MPCRVEVSLCHEETLLTLSSVPSLPALPPSYPSTYPAPTFPPPSHFPPPNSQLLTCPPILRLPPHFLRTSLSTSHPCPPATPHLPPAAHASAPWCSCPRGRARRLAAGVTGTQAPCHCHTGASQHEAAASPAGCAAVPRGADKGRRGRGEAVLRVSCAASPGGKAGRGSRGGATSTQSSSIAC